MNSNELCCKMPPPFCYTIIAFNAANAYPKFSWKFCRTNGGSITSFATHYYLILCRHYLSRIFVEILPNKWRLHHLLYYNNYRILHYHCLMQVFCEFLTERMVCLLTLIYQSGLIPVQQHKQHTDFCSYGAQQLLHRNLPCLYIQPE